TELRDAILDVIERVNENVELPMPKIRPHRLETAPIHIAAKTVHELKPGGTTFLASVPRMRVNPMLERIDGGDPGENLDNSFEMVAARAGSVRRSIEVLDELIAKQFHT